MNLLLRYILSFVQFEAISKNTGDFPVFIFYLKILTTNFMKIF